MSTTYNTTLKSTRMTDVLNAINYGSPSGYIEIGAAGSPIGTILATINFNGNCGAVASGVLTFGVSPPLTCASAAASGTAAAAEVFDAFGSWVIQGLTVGLGGTDIILSSVAIVAGQPVTLTAASISHG